MFTIPYWCVCTNHQRFTAPARFRDSHASWSGYDVKIPRSTNRALHEDKQCEMKKFLTILQVGCRFFEAPELPNWLGKYLVLRWQEIFQSGMKFFQKVLGDHPQLTQW